MPVDKTVGEEIQIVLFCIGRQEFGVPIDQVKEIIMMPEVTPMPNAPRFIEGVINLRGILIVVIDLFERFDLPRIERVETPRIVIVQAAGETVGIIVDAAPKVVRLPLEEIESTPTFVARMIEDRYVKGIGKRGDQLFIMLNLEELLSAEEVASLQKVKENETGSKLEVEKFG